MVTFLISVVKTKLDIVQPGDEKYISTSLGWKLEEANRRITIRSYSLHFVGH